MKSKIKLLIKNFNKSHKKYQKFIIKNIAKPLINKKGFFEFFGKIKKINLYFIILILNLMIFTTSTSAFYPEKTLVSGDQENLAKTISSISSYTPAIEEKNILSDKEVFSYLEKPEIINTKTREEIDKEKIQEEKKIISYNKNRNVVVREKRNYQTEEINSDISSSRGDNRYYYGYCTWYVANRRQDIPNQWGNAKSWLSSAQNSGWPTGNSPQAGSIIVTGESWAGHVGYVEKVEGDKVIISEMNYSGWGRVNTRELDINDPAIRGYIY